MAKPCSSLNNSCKGAAAVVPPQNASTRLHNHNVAPPAVGGCLLRIRRQQCRKRGVGLLLLRPLQALQGECV